MVLNDNRNVPGVSLYFLTLSKLRTIIGSSNSSYLVSTSTLLSQQSNSNSIVSGGKIKLTTAGDLLVGSTARTGVGFLLMPFTLLKTLSEVSTFLLLPFSLLTPSQLQSTTSPTTSSSSLSALQTLYKTGGIKTLWRGAVPTALRDAPGAGLFIVFYERSRGLLGVRGDGAGGAVGGGMAGMSYFLRRNFLSSSRSKKRELFLEVDDVLTFFSPFSLKQKIGATASLLSTLLTTPFDLLKTRRQLSPTLYTSLLTSIKIVYKNGGITSFWEGGGLRVIRKAGSAGIGWAVYESVLNVGERRRGRSTGKD